MEKVMRIYSVGPDELPEEDLNEIAMEKYIWMVYWYEMDFYKGQGEAVLLGKDGRLYVRNLGHYSNGGPLDDWEDDRSVMTIEELLRKKDNIHDFDCKDAVKDMVRSLFA